MSPASRRLIAGIACVVATSLISHPLFGLPGPSPDVLDVDQIDRDSGVSSLAIRHHSLYGDPARCGSRCTRTARKRAKSGGRRPECGHKQDTEPVPVSVSPNRWRDGYGWIDVRVRVRQSRGTPSGARSCAPTTEYACAISVARTEIPTGHSATLVQARGCLRRPPQRRQVYRVPP